MRPEEFLRVRRAVRGAWATSRSARRLGRDRLEDVEGEVLLALVEAGEVRDAGAFAFAAARRVIGRLVRRDALPPEPSIYHEPHVRARGDAWLGAVRDAMVRAGGVVPRSADLLGVSRRTVEEVLRELPDVARSGRGGARAGSGRPRKNQSASQGTTHEG